MAIRKQNKNRLIIVAVALVLGAVGAFGAYRWRQMSRDQDARDYRERGIAALEQGNYEVALDGIGRFLRRLGDAEGTAEDFAQYAKARSEVPAPNNSHLADAIGFYQRSLTLEPDARETQDALLALYYRVGWATEASELIDDMLKRSPDDLELLGKRCDLLEARDQLDAALRESTRLNARAPDDLQGLLRTARLRVRLEQPDREILEWIDGLVAARPNDPNMELVRAFALLNLTQRPTADEGLTEAAGQSIDAVLQSESAVTDPAGLQVLVGVTEGAGRYDEAFRALEAAEDSNDPGVRTQLVRRLWYRHRWEEIPDRVAKWESAGGTIPPEVDAFRAFGLRALGREDEASAIADRMTAERDEAARAWGALVHYVPTVAPDRRLEAIAALQRALQVAPDSAFLHWSLGNLLAVSDVDIARDHWMAAARLGRSWGEPLRCIAQSLLTTERKHMATPLAQEALNRANGTTGSGAAAATLADAIVANLSTLPDAARTEAKAWLASLTEETQGSLSQHFATLQIALLAEEDRDAAAARLREVLASPPEAEESTYLRLARLAESADPTLTQGFLDACEAAHGLTPNLALARALVRLRDADAAAALASFDADLRRAGDGGTELQWEVARASLLDRVSDPSAGRTWIALAEKNPESLPAQLGCVSSQDAWTDRDAIQAAIDRLRKITGDRSVSWRLAQGRWLLADPDAAPELLAKAVSVLSEATRIAPASVEAHLLLARALEGVGGNVERAEAELRTAADLSPGNAGIRLELARITGRQGRSKEARAQLAAILGNGDLSPAQLTSAAMLLAAQGDYRTSADVLTNRVTPEEAPRAGLVALAALYERLGEYERALDLCDRLADQPDLNVLSMTANVNAALGRMDEARRALDRMGSVPGISATDAALARAAFAARWGTADAGRQAYLTAIDAAPNEPRAWIALLGYTIPRGNAAELVAILDDTRADGIEPVQFLRGKRELVLKALPDARLRDVILEAVVRTDAREALMGAAAEVVDAVAKGAPVPPLSESILALADAHRDLISLQLLAGDLAIRASNSAAAIDVTRRTTERFPRVVAPARQLAFYLAGAESWAEALDAALDWREREGGTNLLTDAFIGTAMLNAGRQADALALFQSKADAALADPGANWYFLARYALTLVRAGRPGEAQKLLAPLVEGHETLREGLVSTTGPSILKDARTAVAWLELVEGLIPAAEVERHQQLARWWIAAFERFGGEALKTSALRHIEAQTASPDATSDAFFYAGAMKGQIGDTAGAEEAYRRALELDGDNIGAHNNLAMILADSERADEAVEHASRVLARAPGNPEFMDTMGYTCLRAGKLEEARKQFEGALARVPKNTRFMLNLAETLYALGQYRECRALLARIVEAETLKPELDARDSKRLGQLREKAR